VKDTASQCPFDRVVDPADEALALDAFSYSGHDTWSPLEHLPKDMVLCFAFLYEGKCNHATIVNFQMSWALPSYSSILHRGVRA
jgi:hypothetical protein